MLYKWTQKAKWRDACLLPCILLCCSGCRRLVCVCLCMCGTDLLGCRLVAAPRESLSLDRRSCLASLRVTSDRREDAFSLASSVRNALSTRLLVCFTRGKRLENGWHERETSAKGRETQALFLSRGSQGISCRASLLANKCVCVCTQYDAKKGDQKASDYQLLAL